MKTTLNLLERAKGDGTDADLASRLKVGRTALVMARTKGRCSPELAGQLAELLGEPIAVWMAIAAAEQLPEPNRAHWLRHLATVFALGVVGLVTLATPYSADAKGLSELTQKALCYVN